jgi:multidrug resistance efflux pump
MPLKRTIPLLDRHVSLLSAQQEAEAEMARLEREEEYLRRQVREAREQVQYYEGLLAVLRRDWGRPAPLADLVRKLG